MPPVLPPTASPGFLPPDPQELQRQALLRLLSGAPDGQSAPVNAGAPQAAPMGQPPTPAPPVAMPRPFLPSAPSSARRTQ